MEFWKNFSIEINGNFEEGHYWHLIKLKFIIKIGK